MISCCRRNSMHLGSVIRQIPATHLKVNSSAQRGLLLVDLSFLPERFSESPERSRARSMRRQRTLDGEDRSATIPLGRRVGARTRSCFCPMQHWYSKPFSRNDCRHPSIRTLDERFNRSVQVGCSRFSRCCHVIFDLHFHLYDGIGPGVRRSHRNSALGLWACYLVFLVLGSRPPPATGPVGGCAAVRKLLH
jgi:hypothetical protein